MGQPPVSQPGSSGQQGGRQDGHPGGAPQPSQHRSPGRQVDEPAQPEQSWPAVRRTQASSGRQPVSSKKLRSGPQSQPGITQGSRRLGAPQW